MSRNVLNVNNIIEDDEENKIELDSSCSSNINSLTDNTYNPYYYKKIEKELFKKQSSTKEK